MILLTLFIAAPCEKHRIPLDCEGLVALAVAIVLALMLLPLLLPLLKYWRIMFPG